DNDIHYARDLVNSLDGQMTFIQAPSETALFSWLVENYPREKIIPVYSIQRGAESGSFARPLGDSIDNLKNHPWIILDTGGVVGHSGETLYGGTGRTFDWNLVRNLNRKFFLAGGLNVHNIADAIRITDAQAFDVSSGIEASPGIKDHKMMKRFIQEIRQANDQQGSI
ncbi:MAG: hypothetical protein OEV66_12870, partial [Spirochaetia bacterium]|nr:hypothetical protein [Spirochaetia bacterium]